MYEGAAAWVLADAQLNGQLQLNLSNKATACMGILGKTERRIKPSKESL